MKDKHASIRFDPPKADDDMLERIRAALEGMEPATPVSLPQNIPKIAY
ncbi:hypothetical protein [Paracoccus saliphilus]|uniref:Uncharacterized protein n=1 Tax=Paracoccus saliphilus TaxID=405559 RepID=A0ABY7SB44_9RHOB|nr:hypothetical protein [Paracoccus saliphilus]WCR02931.1 hypothetical protein JHX88_19335 [Paracoccus saliphilus]